MKPSRILPLSAAIATAVGSFGAVGVAHALDLNDTSKYGVAGGGAYAVDVVMSGASAQDNAVEDLFGTLCSAGTIDTFRFFVGTVNDDRALTCEASGITGIANGTPIRVRKTAVGGSGNGVQPVANGTALAFPNPATSNVCDAGSTQSRTTPLKTYQRHSCNVVSTQNLVPELGFSDVEPGIFGYDAAVDGALVISGTNDLVFGITVTKNLWDALKTLQNVPAGESNLPNLTSSQVTALLTGSMSNWNNIRTIDGTTSLASNTVYICRRVSSSGTQKITEITFLGVPCYSSAAVPLGAGPTVFENSGSSDLRNCLNDQHSKGRWALGLLSTESNPNTNWRYVKIDGEQPDLAATAAGKYPFFGSLTFQRRDGDSNPIATPATSVSVYDALISQFIKEPVVEQLNAGFRWTYGDGGYLVPALTALNNSIPQPVNFQRLTVRPQAINSQSHALSGEILNCQRPGTLLKSSAGS